MDLAYSRDMVKVASSEGVSIYCPREGKYSFFNSPYPAHRAHTAIDIYPNRAFGSVAPSPVSGEVRVIRRVACPEKETFKSTSYDYVILIQSLENPGVWVKILHVEPLVEVGGKVDAGDDLGVLLRSGFFDFWTEPHIHVEVRRPSDPIRARGGLILERETGVPGDGDCAELEELRGVVVEARAEYALMLLDEEVTYGVPVRIYGCRGIIDGGIPHYGFFGVHVSGGSEPLRGARVELCGTDIGIVEWAYGDAYLARCLNKTFMVGCTPVRLSFYLHPQKPLVKIIPYGLGELRLKKSEEVRVRILG